MKEQVAEEEKKTSGRGGGRDQDVLYRHEEMSASAKQTSLLYLKK